MQSGQCKLCGQTAELIESHVWPRFAYKNYVSDLDKGGSFFDLKAGRHVNKQYKRFWFCRECDGRRLGHSESYAAELLVRMEKNRAAPFVYDTRLLTFAVSVSLRTAMAYMQEHKEFFNDASLNDACGAWRQYLLGRRKTGVKPYSQHLFVIYGQDVDWHKGMGGYPYSQVGLVLSQVGPLFIAGLLDRKRLSAADLKVWARSELCLGGGVAEPVSEWRIGYNITETLGRLLHMQQAITIDRVKAAHRDEAEPPA